MTHGYMGKDTRMRARGRLCVGLGVGVSVGMRLRLRVGVGMDAGVGMGACVCVCPYMQACIDSCIPTHITHYEHIGPLIGTSPLHSCCCALAILFIV